MKIPIVFQWPTPWFWGAIGVLIVSTADGFSDVLTKVAVFTLIASGIHYVRSRGATSSTPAPVGETEQRLQAIERRLTDTQDVMISLSEKVDAWEARSREANVEQEGAR